MVCTDYKQVHYEVKKNVTDQFKNNGTYIKSESTQHNNYRKRNTKRRNLDTIPIYSTTLNVIYLITIIDFPAQIPLENFNVLNCSLRAPPPYFL